MKTVDQIFYGIGAGTGLLFAILSKRDEDNARADATLRIGGGAMLLTTLFGDASNKVRKSAASAVVIMAPEIAGKVNSSGILGELGDLADARHQLYTMPKEWWREDASRGLKNCYANKAEALRRFASYNSSVIDNYSGISHEESPAEFDSINAKYGLSGNRAVVNIAQALWVAMPPGRPYCLADIDLEALNATSPAREDPNGVGFQIPDYALIDKMNREQMEFWRRQEREEVRAPKATVVSPQARLPASSDDEIPF